MTASLFTDFAATAIETAKAREHIKQQGLYGKVSVQHWNKDYLPYTDNLVNLLVAEDLGDVPMREVMRVLAPRGVACVKSGETWKTDDQTVA